MASSAKHEACNMEHGTQSNEIFVLMNANSLEYGSVAASAVAMINGCRLNEEIAIPWSESYYYESESY